ncbi:MAG: vitamin K epoxide reductase family protein [Thermoplasmata archaeon]
MRTSTFRSLLALGGGLGLIISIFAALEFYDAELSNLCTLNAFFSCALIAHSGKTTTFGIQDYDWGIAGFIAILVLAVIAERRRKDARLAYLLALLTSAGLALSAYFLYVELVEIRGLCPVCLAAYGCGILAWVGSLGLARKAYRREHATPDPAPAGG